MSQSENVTTKELWTRISLYKKGAPTSSPSSLSTLTPPDDDDNAAGLNGEDRGLAAVALTTAAVALEKDRCSAAAALTSADSDNYAYSKKAEVEQLVEMMKTSSEVCPV